MTRVRTIAKYDCGNARIGLVLPDRRKRTGSRSLNRISGRPRARTKVAATRHARRGGSLASGGLRHNERIQGSQRCESRWGRSSTGIDSRKELHDVEVQPGTTGRAEVHLQVRNGDGTCVGRRREGVRGRWCDAACAVQGCAAGRRHLRLLCGPEQRQGRHGRRRGSRCAAADGGGEGSEHRQAGRRRRRQRSRHRSSLQGGAG